MSKPYIFISIFFLFFSHFMLQAKPLKYAEAPIVGCPNCSVSPLGLAMIRQYEGFSPACYQDVAGYWTIGYGHKLNKKSDCPTPVSIGQAETLLNADIISVEWQARGLVKVPLTQGQFDALVSLIYNVGGTKLEKSSLIKLLNEKKYTQAGGQFQKWVYAGSKKNFGLEMRRNLESFFFLNA